MAILFVHVTLRVKGYNLFHIIYYNLLLFSSYIYLMSYIFKFLTIIGHMLSLEI